MIELLVGVFFVSKISGTAEHQSRVSCKVTVAILAQGTTSICIIAIPLFCRWCGVVKVVVNVNDEVLLIHNPEAGTLGSEVRKLLQSVSQSVSRSRWVLLQSQSSFG